MVPSLSLVAAGRGLARRTLLLLGRPRAAAAVLAPLLLVPGTLAVPLFVVLGRERARSSAGPPALAAGTIDDVPPAEVDPVAQLLRALEEAHRNCEAARALTRGRTPPPGAPLFRTVELETALLENPWVTDRALGELDALLDEAAWLAALEPHAALGQRSWEDVRFLLGAIHWYLERAWDAAARSEEARRAHAGLAGALEGKPLPSPRRHEGDATAYDRRSLREFHDLPTFEDLLGRWD